MPPRIKRPLSEKDTNAQAQPNKKSQKRSKNDTVDGASEENVVNSKASKGAEETDESGGEEEPERQPHEYYCINRPRFDMRNENKEKPKDQQLDSDKIAEKQKEMLKSSVLLEPAAEHPDHKWIAMWQTWTIICDWNRRASYTDPDNFSMYIYNDFHGYGIQELVENLIEAFNKELNKKNRDVFSIWAIMAGLIHWLQIEDLCYWFGLEDGERWCRTTRLIGIAFLETLHELDRANKLTPVTPDSSIKDLALVISLYLDWAQDLGDYGVDDEDLEWRKNVIAYAKKGGIDLVEDGCAGMCTTLESYKEMYGEVEALKGDGKGKTRWQWRKIYKDFEEEYGMGGDHYNILKMSRSERASLNFDKKDPLADVSDKDLEEENIMFR